MTTVKQHLLACCVIAALGTAAHGGEYQWLPVGASGGHTIVGNEITLQETGQTVMLELRLAGWGEFEGGDARLSAFQATLDPSGYYSGTGAPLSPLDERPCTVDGDCETGGCGNVEPGICDYPHPEEGGFQITNICTADGVRCTFADDDCPPDGPFAGGNYCVTNPEWPFSIFQAAVSVLSLDYQYLGASQSGCLVDN